MAHIKPFEGLCYRLEKPEDLGNYVSPPYDMIDASMVDELYRKDPFNVARIIQNKPQATDKSNKDRHLRAADFFRAWIREGRIERDAGPSIYLYRQQFTLMQADRPVSYTRTGAIVAVKLVDYEEGVVFPHEYTLTGPKADRYELLQAVKSHTELIFGIVPDTDRAVFSAISSAVPAQCRGFFIDGNGVRHSLFRNNDPSAAALLTRVLNDRTILIADGHHRYETALRFAKETNNPAYGYIMMNLVSMADPGLVIRAFHRVLKKYPGTEGVNVALKLAAYFQCADLGPASIDKVNDFLIDGGGHEMLFLDARRGRMMGLSLNEQGERFLADNARGMSAAWNHLDVSKINSIVVNGLLGLPLDGTTLHDVMDYVNDAPAAYNHTMSDANSLHGAFFIRPMDINAVTAIVSGKERMPQKSTNFFPKCFSGLVFNDMENA
jgi:uncharacterized protein (DUF1015 family)